jgi:8-oxo-dGTP pyrophosphatase MutT (NUDIX family)
MHAPHTMASDQQLQQQPSQPSFDFKFDDVLSPWNITAQAWLQQHQKPWDGLASGVFVFDAAGKVLLIQRASHDSMGDRWEVPGGAVDDEDPSILHGAARELWEEAGLVATGFRSLVVARQEGDTPGHVFSNRTRTKTFCRIAFAADVKATDKVTLDPNEHQAYVWATEDQVREEKIEDQDIPITYKDMKDLILASFKSRRGDN